MEQVEIQCDNILMQKYTEGGFLNYTHSFHEKSLK